MAGHSKWANIKHRKGAQDAKRGKIFTKIIREITVAAKDNPDIEANPRLRTAVNKARAANMPSDNIDRAIKKGSGTLDGVVYEEVRYEGYGPGGIAIMVDCLTDNKNRTAPEVRSIFSKNGGNLGESGCVSYMFDRKGVIIIEEGQTTEDDVMELLLEFDVEDIKTEDGNIVITTSVEGYNDCSDTLQKKDLKLVMDETTFIPQTEVTLDESRAAQCMRLVDLLENQDDVQNVYANFDIPDDIMEKISAEQE